jgi:hypothetical protein
MYIFTFAALLVPYLLVLIFCSLPVVLFVRINTLPYSFKIYKAAMSLHCIKYLKCFSHPFTVRHYECALKVTSVEVVEMYSNVIAAVSPVSAITQHY